MNKLLLCSLHLRLSVDQKGDVYNMLATCMKTVEGSSVSMKLASSQPANKCFSKASLKRVAVLKMSSCRKYVIQQTKFRLQFAIIYYTKHCHSKINILVAVYKTLRSYNFMQIPTLNILCNIAITYPPV